jgi:hypothetical protein
MYLVPTLRGIVQGNNNNNNIIRVAKSFHVLGERPQRDLLVPVSPAANTVGILGWKSE